MLGVEPDRELAQPVLQDLLRPAADQVHLGLGARGQRPQQAEQGGVRPGELRRGREGDQGAVVVEQQEQSVGLGDPIGQLAPCRHAR